MRPKSSPPRKRPTKSSSAVSKPKKVAAPVVEEPVVEEQVVEKMVAGESDDSQVDELSGRFTEFLAKIQNIASQMSGLKAEFRLLEKAALREMKAAKKLSQKKKRQIPIVRQVVCKANPY